MDTSNITNTPIKFSNEEIQEIKNIQQKYNEKMMMFSQLYIDKIAIEEDIANLQKIEKQTKEEYILLQKSEVDLLTKLTSKYGEGNLNLKDGTFTPKN